MHFKNTTCVTLLCLAVFVMATNATVAAPKKFGGTWTDAKAVDIPADFSVQGEYVGEIKGGGKLGCQVIALDKGAFQAVVYPGGLPGDGWDGRNKILMDGKTDGDETRFNPASGKKRYLAGSPAEFSATRSFPPEGHKEYTAAISKSTMNGATDDGKTFELKRIVRESPTLGMKPPKEAIVLFDGTNKDEWTSGRVDETTKLLNTDGSDILTKRKFNNYTMHLEFMLPYRPAARGQGRGNSGFYQIDHYEVQVLDSFGLDGLNNECGGIYSKAECAVNMCYPPLTWQTYDVEFTNAIVEDGKKVKDAVITVKHNGVVIHDKLNLTGKTGGSRREPEGTPGAHKLQGHGNPLQYRNIWIVEND